jgi:PIN domain nuclease of toxin-antitoxin system
MPVSAEAALAYFEESGYRMLAVEPQHAVAVGTLPAHHNDPFDRMLVAQARVATMRLLTADAVLAPYGDWVERV